MLTNGKPSEECRNDLISCPSSPGSFFQRHFQTFDAIKNILFLYNFPSKAIFENNKAEITPKNSCCLQIIFKNKISSSYDFSNIFIAKMLEKIILQIILRNKKSKKNPDANRK